MQYLTPKELSNIRQLKKEGKFKQALKVINGLEDKKHLSVQDQFEIHHLKSSILCELGHENEALKYTELAYKESQQLKNNLQIIDVLLSKAVILRKSSRINEALETIIKAEQILNKINQISSTEFKEKKAFIVFYKGTCYCNIGDFNRSLKYNNECLTIAKEIKNKQLLMLATKRFSLIYSLKGEYNRAFEYEKRHLSLAKELDDKQEIIGALNEMGIFYTEKGDFNQALDYLERSLSLCDEISSYKTIYVLDSLLDLYLKMDSLEKAQQYLDRMKKTSDQLDNISNFYLLSKAVLLKKKPKYINHLKAKEILKQIVEEDGTFVEINYAALIHLCDLYLKELKERNNLNLIDEIQPYITQLMYTAKSQQSFWLLVEAYSFQAKLKLITFEFKEAQKLLTQALNIAEKYGQNLQAERIKMEQDKLLNEKNKWETLRRSNAIMAERIELAHLNDQIVRMLRRRYYSKKA